MTLKAKIIGFTKFEDGQDRDCIAITDKGEKIIVDPFVGCSWSYKDREHLLNMWFEDEKAFQHKSGVWLTSEHLFKIIHNPTP